jgi:protein-tyrosine phosphatase
MSSTRVVTACRQEDCSDAIRQGVDVLRSGGLVAFPTETVYGLGARVGLPDALARLRQAKQRQDDKPFTIHIGRRAEVEKFVPDLEGVGRRLVQNGWPGPLTIIFCDVDPDSAPIAAEAEPSAVAAMYHQGTVGLRCPDDRIAADLLAGVGAPVVAASANLPGRRPPRSADEVLAEFDGQIDLLLDGGPARYAKSSTVVRVSGQNYEIVREGVYDARALRRLAMVHVLLVCTGNTCRSPMAAALLTKLLAESSGVKPAKLSDRGFKVTSAGTGAIIGAPAAPQAVEVMQRYGMDLRDHRAQALTADLIQRADCILTMTASHRNVVLGMLPSASQRCRLLAADHGIDDPIGQAVEVYAACAAEMEAALRDRIAEGLE